MTQKGEHTWDLILQYHQCPNCGYINESREDFQNYEGKWIKKIVCARCHHEWTMTKPRKRTFGPLIGTPQPPEIDWS